MSKIKVRLSYLFGAFGHDFFAGVMMTYFIMFVTNHLFNTGNKNFDDKMVVIVTTLIVVIRICELFLDPFIGNAIDKTKTRWGKFKPWVVIGSIISGICLAILFTNMGGLTSRPILYLIIFAIVYIIMDIFYSFKDVGLWSMVPALSFDSLEREVTATFGRFGSTIGANLVTVAVVPIVLFFSVNQNSGAGDDRGWFAFGLITAILSILGAIIIGIGTKEVNSELRKNKTETSISKVFSMLFHNDQLMWTAFSYLIYALGWDLVNSLMLYYFTFVLGEPKEYSIYGTINVIIGMISVSLFPSLAKKFHRRNVLITSILVMLASLILLLLANNSVPLTIFAAVMVTLPTPLVFLVVMMTMTDTVEYAQLKLGHRDESLVLSVRPLVDKLASAVVNGIVGITVIVAGMSGSATFRTVTEAGKTRFKGIMIVAPMILLIMALFIFLKKVKITEEKHAEIVDKLEKTWHEQIDQPTVSISIPPKTIDYVSPATGEILALSKVTDKNFSSGNMGRGFAIKPKGNHIISPFNGTVEATFPTKHSIGLKSDNGILTLIHVGIGTVNMKGEGFKQFVVKGQHVNKGQKLLEFSDALIKQNHLDDTIMVVIPNHKSINTFEYVHSSGNIINGENILRLSGPNTNK